jgi:hypothetical protein
LNIYPFFLKKITIISLLILLFVSQIGYRLLYAYQQLTVQEEMKEKILAGIGKADMQIVVNNPTIKWLDNKKEFILNDELFDVIEIKIENGEELIYCISDKKEQQLIANYNKILKTTHSDNSKQNNKHYINFSTVEFLVSSTFNISPISYSIKMEYPNFDSKINYLSLKILVPPPMI